MLWALISSAYIIYLYRKLKAAGDESSASGGPQPSGIDVEIDKLNQRLASLEERLSGGKGRETVQ